MRIPTADTMELLAGFKTPPPIVGLEQVADLQHAEDAGSEEMKTTHPTLHVMQFIE